MTITVDKVQEIKNNNKVSNNVTSVKEEPVFNYEQQAPADSIVTKRMWSENTKSLLFDAVQDMGIKNYTPSILKDNNTAIEKAQKHLIDLMKYYEGDRNYYYEAFTAPYKDKFGNTTSGFGELSNKYMTQEKAYENLCKNLKSYTNEVRNFLNNKIGKNTYEQLPNSIKEGLIDLCYNKGLGKISGNKDLINAVKENDYSKIISNLVYLYSGKTSADKKEDPGLYRRSLNRAILAARDLNGKELNEAKLEIEKIYNKAVECHKQNNASLTELNKIYEQFKYGKISTPAVSAESFKVTIGENFKGKGLWGVAQALYKSLGNPEISFQDFYKKVIKLNGDSAEIKIGQDFKVPYLKSVSAGNSVNNIAPVDTQVVKTVNKDEKEKKPEKAEEQITEKPGFLKRAWRKIKSILNQFGNWIKNLFSSQNEELVINSQPAAELTPFEKLVRDGKSVQDGEFQIITMDYEVKKGDNLWRLSREYNTSEEIICNDNNIKNKNNISEGQILKIQKLGYKVEKGDNLYQIAKKFGLTVEILKDLNNIEDVNVIKAGQMLEIPGFIYNVKPKDTLFGISKQVGVSIEDLKKINGLASDSIVPNQKIKIVYNDSDFAVSADKKKVCYDSKTNTKKEVIDMAGTANLANRPLLQKKRKENGKVVATREVFDYNVSGALSGKTIIVNAGHGYSQANTDIGTPGLKGLDDEWLLNYDNAMKLIDKLCAKGAKVIFLQGKRRLIEEEMVKSRNKADLFISVHVNSSAKPTQDRTQIYYRDKGVSGEPKQNSIILANIMEKNFDEWIPKHEAISSADKFIFQEKQDYAQSSVNDNRTGLLKTPLNYLQIPGVIWEVAFMSSQKGRERLKDANLMSDYADIMAKSVVEFQKLKLL